MPDPYFIPSEQFVRMVRMELVDLFLLLENKKLPIKYINHHLHIDISDKRARQYLPDYKIAKDLFAQEIRSD
jgi:hypothetical protein